MVQSHAEMPAEFLKTFRRRDYEEIIRHADNLEETAARLRNLGTRYVVAGSEWGVNLADQLSEALGLASNGARLTHARRNKFMMAQAVTRRGLRTPRQFCAGHVEQLLAWVRRNDCWPIVVKPPHSMSSEGVCLCGSETEVAQAFARLSGKVNKLGLVNETVLVQEFLEGPEYIVDTVSSAGQHRLIAIWKYTKQTAQPGLIGSFETKELLDREGDLARRLFEYASGVLDALEISYGPGHCEIVLVDGEPYLLELGARTHGGELAHATCRAATGLSQIDATVESYLDPARFLRRPLKPRARSRGALMILLKPGLNGRVRAFKNLPEIKALPSFHGLHMDARLGQPPPRFLGLVILLHRERAIIEQDLRRIRELEEDGFYETE
jgi:biotin carboxylase